MPSTSASLVEITSAGRLPAEPLMAVVIDQLAQTATTDSPASPAGS
jgi:hypothetical protein